MNNATIKALREMGTGSTGYSHTLVFTREFTKGTLVGLTHEDSIGFCSATACNEWVSAVNRANKAGKVDYKVISWKVVAS